MKNDPNLHTNQIKEADDASKEEELRQTNEFIKQDEVISERPLSEEEKAKRSKPEDYEKFNFNSLDM